MTEKVIINQRQADAIERYKKEQREQLESLNENSTRHESWAQPLVGMDVDKIIASIHDGYEVEPEFKVGQFVIDVTTNVTREVKGEDMARFLNWEYIRKQHVRHATESEIAAEKERRWWGKHGRGIWELRKGDALVHARNGKDWRIVKEVGEHVVDNYSFLEHKTVTSTIRYVTENFTIICFAESRLDGDTN